MTLGTFVENKIKEIKEDRNINFHYIWSSEKPADTAGRGTIILDLEDNEGSWHGPNWLKNPKHTWPDWKSISTCRQNNEIQAQTESELRKNKVTYEAKLVAEDGLLESNRTSFGIDLDRFSSL